MMGNIFSDSAVEAYSGAFIQQMINIKGVMQGSFLQVVVGFYTLTLLALLGYFVGGLQNGIEDRIGIQLSMGRSLALGTVIYIAVATVVVLVFGGMGTMVTSGM